MYVTAGSWLSTAAESKGPGKAGLMRPQFQIRFSKRGPLTRAAWPALASVGVLAASGCSSEVGGSTPNDSLGAMVPPGAGGGAAPGGGTASPGSTVGPDGVAAPGAVGPAGTTPGGETPVPGEPGATPADGTADPVAPPEVDPAIYDATDVTLLRLLTQVEYRNTIAALIQGADVDSLDLPDDTVVADYGTVGAATVTVNEVAAELYEAASQEVTLALFNDDQRWPQHVGCMPQADLSDACVETYVRSFGRRAFRRDLTDEEAQQWIDVARSAATLSESAETGLATATSGILQSPNFLYRVEDAQSDLELGRIRFDGLSMATRLSYLLTGAAPSDSLLDTAAAGGLDTPDGVRAAAAELFNQEGSSEFMAEFFSELTGARRVIDAEKDLVTFSSLTDELRNSMLEEVQLWMSNVVLAPQADVRGFYNSTTTFVDGPLADFYGIQAPAGGGFQQVDLGADANRSGILGKAAFLMVHSSPDSSNPTRRGKFILQQFMCLEVPPPPAGLVVTIPEQNEETGPMTTRELFEQHGIDASCIGCHSVMDPFGFALEHFDAAGQYRETENGLTIDATGSYGDRTFDGAVELGQVLFDDEGTPGCFVKNFYRYANGTEDDQTDAALIDELAATLVERGHVWRELLTEFASSNAFNSLAPTASAQE